MSFYIGLIHKEDDSTYGISFPDFPGCISFGDTADKVMENGISALRMHAAAIVEDGGQVPIPNSIETIQNSPEAWWQIEGATFVLVPLLLNAPRYSRVNISIDTNTLSTIDAAAKHRGLTRSAFIAQAAQNEILRIGG